MKKRRLDLGFLFAFIVLDPLCAWNLPLSNGKKIMQNNNRQTATASTDDGGVVTTTMNVLVPPVPTTLPAIGTTTAPAAAALDLSDTQSVLKRALDQVGETNTVVLDYLRKVYNFALTIILYRPPVGIVALFGLHRIYTKLTQSPTTVQEINNQENKRSKGRKFFLDTDDADYLHHGGIDHVRAKLCRAALLSNSSGKDTHSKLAVQGLEVTHRPGDSRLRLVQELAGSLSVLEQVDISNDKTLTIARMLLQVRAIDALLRIARDRLLKVAFRLQRTCDHYAHRLQATKAYPNFVQRFLKDSVAADQTRLSAATAAYHAELKRLGEIAQVLADRPGDMGQDFLIRALKETDEIQRNEKYSQQFNSTWWTRFSKLKMPNVGHYSLRWNVEGRGRFSLRKMESDGYIESATARRTLLSDGSNMGWLRQADQWTSQARSKLGEILRLVHSDSVGESHFDVESFESVQDYWCTQNKRGNWNGHDLWIKTLRLVDGLHADRRVGEGKAVRLRDAALVDWTRKLDFTGLPSTVLAICLANVLHNRLSPYWPAFKKESLAVYDALLDIGKERFWSPLKSILDDLMNKSPTMMSAFGLDIEEASLDHMLRDLGYGDGSPEMRREGLKFAAEQYEDSLQNHLVGNLVRGKLVRLMLIQVQQLKVGVLSALETIDVLMKGNRIYFSVLAGIPAVMIATYGTKFLWHFMYNIRSRDLRPVKTVHKEMQDLLAYAEEIILLGNLSHTGDGATRLTLQSFELGQILLTVHRYLILMDYSSPPFPSGQCDQIHENLRKLFGTDGILNRVMDDGHRRLWIQLVQKKHQELLKHL